MGGKHKQAQRTKNNVKPSSSGRSAELLGSTASLVGFSAVKDGGYVPVLPGFSLSVEEPDSTVHPSFQLVLKKMNKKDATTKIKALQEFGDLCKQSEADNVKAVLPFWPRLYCQLAVDVDHRVREAAHQAHNEVVLQVKRNLAPYLKVLSGPWFTCQYDTYAPAASAAKTAFQSAFPPAKLNEAIIFCKDDILNYIYDSLINQTEQTWSNPKTTPAEEMEAKYQRLLISSLQGYSLYLQKLPLAELNKVEEMHKKLLSSSKFWKYSKHKVPMVRGAWFCALVSLCHKMSDFVSDYASQLVPSIFGNLDERDPTVLPLVWEAALHALVTVKDCWSFVNAEKMVFPKLWHILREGGQGNAATIFPMLLPFLSKMPSELITEKKEFYMKFFDNLRKGLEHKSVQQSQIESCGIIVAFMEALRYIIMNHHEDLDFCKELLSQQLLILLEDTIVNPKRHNCMTPLYKHIFDMLQCWWNIHKSEKNSNYEILLSFLVDIIYQMFHKLVVNHDGKSEWILRNQVEFLVCLKNPHLLNKKQDKKVTFREENENVDAQSEVEEEVTVDFPGLVSVDPIKDFVFQLCFLYLQEAQRTGSSCMVLHFARLLVTFESQELFLHLNNKANSSSKLFSFFDDVLYPWVKDPIMCSECLVESVFLLLEYLKTEEKTSILHSLVQVNNSSVLLWCLSLSVTKYHKDACVRQWLKSQELGQLVVGLAKNLSLSRIQKHSPLEDEQTGHMWEILKYCFSTTPDGDLLVGTETLSLILEIFCETLSTSTSTPTAIPDLDLCAIFVAELANIVCSGEIGYTLLLQKSVPSQELFLVMFKLCCHLNNGLQASTLDKLNSAWVKGISCLAKTIGNTGENIEKLSSRFADVVRELLYNEDLSICHVEHLVQKVVSFCRAVINCYDRGEEEWDNCIKLIKIFLPNRKQWDECETLLHHSCIEAELIKGNLSFFSYNMRTSQTVKLLDYNIMVLYTSVLVTSIPMCFEMDCGAVNSVPEEGVKVDENSYDTCSRKLEDFMENFADMLFALTLMESYLQHYTSTSQYNKLTSKYNYTRKITIQLLRSLDNDLRERMTNKVIERVKKQGGLTAKMLHFWMTEILSNHNLDDVYKTLLQDVNEWSEWQLHVAQVLIPHLQWSQAFDIMCVEVGKLAQNENLVPQNHASLSVLTQVLQHKDLDVSACTEAVIGSLEIILRWRKINERPLLFSCDMGSRELKEIHLIIQLTQYLRTIVNKVPSVIQNHHWDFILCSLASWAKSIGLTMKHIPNNKYVVACMSSLCQLISSVTAFMGKLTEEVERERYPQELLTEWNEFFAEHVYVGLCSLFSHIAGKVNVHVPSETVLLMEKLCEAMRGVPSDWLLTHASFFVKDASPKECTDDNVRKLISYFSVHLYSPVKQLQFSAFEALMKLVPKAAEIDMTLAAEGCESEDITKLKLLCFELKNALEDTQTVVDTMLMEFRIGDHCTVQPYTDTYTYTMAYLLLWKLLLEMCRCAESELRYQYAHWLRNSNYLKSLLNNLFRLMPEMVLHLADAKVNFTSTHKLSELFSVPPALAYSGPVTPQELQHIVCWVYCDTLRRLPALVRQWWSETDQRVSGLVERVTMLYISPYLCHEEMKAIQQEEKKFDNMEIIVHSSVREVVALYKVDEAKMELLVQLSQNHPLGPVKVESKKHGVGLGQWRNWMMQLTIFLTHQNGSIWDGLKLWKKNLDKRFEGVEECYICFSILHGSNYQIPKLSCQTCKKKFHSPCLYKWFSTSNNSTCPICRNLF